MNRKNNKCSLQPFVLENVRRSPRKNLVKEKEKGRRKLDFNKDNKKMTRNILHGYIAYVDVKFNTKAEAVKKRITALGGVVEEFLDKKINLIVTCQNITDLTDKHGYVLQSIQSPMSATQPSPLQPFSNKQQSYGYSPFSTDSPQNSVEGGKKERLSNEFSLGKKLINRALCSRKGAGIPNICQRARDMRARLLSVDDFYKRFMQSKNSTSNISSLKDKPLHNSKKTATRTVAEIQVVKLNKPFFKIMDVKRVFRPLVYETKSWPRIHEDTSLYQSPFELPKEKNHNKSKAIIDAECEMGDKETLSLADKSEKISEHEEASKAKPVSPVSRPSTAKKKTPKKHVEKPGYCDICTVRYKDLKKHLKNNIHRKFVTNKDNFKQLDDLIKEHTPFHELINDLKACAQLKQHHRQFDETMKEDGSKKKKQKSVPSIPCFLGYENNGVEVYCNPKECKNSHEKDSDDVIDDITTTVAKHQGEAETVVNIVARRFSGRKDEQLKENNFEKENLIQRTKTKPVAAICSPIKVIVTASNQQGCVSQRNIYVESVSEVADADSVFMAPPMISTPIKQPPQSRADSAAVLSLEDSSCHETRIVVSPTRPEMCSNFSVSETRTQGECAIAVDPASSHTPVKRLVVPNDTHTNKQVIVTDEPGITPSSPPVCMSPVIRRTKRTRKRQRRRTLSSSSELTQSQYTQETTNNQDDDVNRSYDDNDFICIIEEEVQRQQRSISKQQQAETTNAVFQLPTVDSYNEPPDTFATNGEAPTGDHTFETTSSDCLCSPATPSKKNENKKTNKKQSKFRERKVITLDSDPEVVFNVRNDNPILQRLFSPYKSTAKCHIETNLTASNCIIETNDSQATTYQSQEPIPVVTNDLPLNGLPVDIVNNNNINNENDIQQNCAKIDLKSSAEHPSLLVIGSTNQSIPGGLQETLTTNDELMRNSSLLQANIYNSNNIDITTSAWNSPVVNPCIDQVFSQHVSVANIKTPTKTAAGIAFSDDEDIGDVTYITSIADGLKVEEFHNVDKISVAILKHGSTPESGKSRRTATPCKERQISGIYSPQAFARKITPNSKVKTRRRSSSSTTVESSDLLKSPSIVSCKRNLRSMNTPPRRREAFNGALNQLNKYSPDTSLLSKQRYYDPKKKRNASTPASNGCRKRSRSKTPSSEIRSRKKSRNDDNSGSVSSGSISKNPLPPIEPAGHQELNFLEGVTGDLLDENITELVDDVFANIKPNTSDKENQEDLASQKTLRNASSIEPSYSVRSENSRANSYSQNGGPDHNSKPARYRDTPSEQDLVTIQGFIYDRIKNNPRRSSSLASQSFSHSSSRASSPSRNNEQRKKSKSSHEPHENDEQINRHKSRVPTTRDEEINKNMETTKSARRKNTELSAPLRTSPRKTAIAATTEVHIKGERGVQYLRSSPRKHAIADINTTGYLGVQNTELPALPAPLRTSPRKTTITATTTTEAHVKGERGVQSIRSSPRKHTIADPNTTGYLGVQNLRSSPRKHALEQQDSNETSSKSSLTKLKTIKNQKSKQSPFSAAVKAEKKKSNQPKNSSFEVFEFNGQDVEDFSEHSSPFIKKKKKKNKNTSTANHSQSFSEQSFDNTLVKSSTLSNNNSSNRHSRKASKITAKCSAENKIYLVKDTDVWKVQDSPTTSTKNFQDSDNENNDEEDDFVPTKKSRKTPKKKRKPTTNKNNPV